jgi:myo-inositol-1(or 4)-monophosphatase
MTLSPHQLLPLALHAVDQAEAALKAATPGPVTHKAPNDPVTDTDTAVERLVRDTLHRAAPDIAFFGEEGGGDLSADAVWVLDPIDGTANWIRHLPVHGISLALMYEQRAVLGVIALPQLAHRYWAVEGHGAWRNHQPIHAAATTELGRALVAIGDYGIGPAAREHTAATLRLHQHLAPAVSRIRMLGSAAADLAWVADGTLDASLTLSNQWWDMAAGTAIAREAGALICDLDGTPHSRDSRTTIAAAPAIQPQLLTLARTACPSPPTAGSTPC